MHQLFVLHGSIERYVKKKFVLLVLDLTHVKCLTVLPNQKQEHISHAFFSWLFTIHRQSFENPLPAQISGSLSHTRCITGIYLGNTQKNLILELGICNILNSQSYFCHLFISQSIICSECPKRTTCQGPERRQLVSVSFGIIVGSSR